MFWPEELLGVIGLHTLLDILIIDFNLNFERMLGSLIFVVNGLTMTALSYRVGQFEYSLKSVFRIVKHLSLLEILVAG